MDLPSELYWLMLGFALTAGLCVGSFLNVVVYRLPLILNGEGASVGQMTLSFPASHCPDCKSKVRAWQNIPVVSYLLLRGRCAHCKSPIGWQYPLVEVVGGIIGVGAILLFEVTPLGAIFAGLSYLLLALALIVIKGRHRPPLQLSVGVALTWLLSLFFDGGIPVWLSVTGALLAYVTFSFVRSYPSVFGNAKVTRHDMVLAVCLGLWTGPLFSLIAVVLALWLGNRNFSRATIFILVSWVSAAGLLL